MSQTTTTEEGGTFEHLWSSLEPDSTYFELPAEGQSQSGDSSGPQRSSDVSMEVYHMRDINHNVMVQYRFGQSV
uniref:Uncharacterized protein n=1 Tax=Knipowitschia caucasica TaxID=637954 RepID=A0AAV2LXR7_KNICA